MLETALREFLVGVVALVLGWIGLWMNRIRTRRRAQDVAGALISHGVLTAKLSSVCRKVGARRAMLVKAHNGGSVPVVGRPLYVTIVAEWSGGDLPFNAPSFQATPVDGAYISEVLLPMLSTGRALIDTCELSKGGFLRDVYLTQGVQVADVWLIGVDVDRSELYYAVLHWTDDSTYVGDRAETRSYMRTLVEDARGMLDLEDVSVVRQDLRQLASAPGQ